MRWTEIFEDDGVVNTARQTIVPMLTSLKAQGVEKVTVDQLIGLLQKDNNLEGVSIEGDLVNQAIDGIQGFNIEPDPETGKMTVFIDNPTAGRQVDQKQAEKDEKNIHSAAMRSLDKKDSEL